MGLDQIVGLIIAVLALIYMAVSGARNKARKKNLPDEFNMDEDEQQKRLREFLHGLKDDMNESEAEEEKKEGRREPPPPMPVRQQTLPVTRDVEDKFKYKTKYDTFKPVSKIDTRDYATNIDERTLKQFQGPDVVSQDMRLQESKAYEIVKKNEVSRAEKLLLSLSSKKDMMIIHEIFSAPKGF